MPDGYSMLFMRGVKGQPLNSMRALANISVFAEERRFPISGQYSRMWIYQANITRQLLQPGFQYAFRMLSTTYLPKEIAQYQIDLLASQPNVSGEFRIIDGEPQAPPLGAGGDSGVWITDTEPFSLYTGPIVGSLECTNPADGVGFQMQTLFRFEQIWASDVPPLEYAYFYAEVPESRRADFMEEKA
jgi:hypothetical protein